MLYPVKLWEQRKTAIRPKTNDCEDAFVLILIRLRFDSRHMSFRAHQDNAAYNGDAARDPSMCDPVKNRREHHGFSLLSLVFERSFSLFSVYIITSIDRFGKCPLRTVGSLIRNGYDILSSSRL